MLVFLYLQILLNKIPLKQKESKILIILIRMNLSKENKKEEKLEKIYHWFHLFT
jgi:hypothetical protein